MRLAYLESSMLRRAVSVAVLASLSLICPGVFAAAQIATNQSFLPVQPRDRITGYIDDERTTVLRGNRHPLATAANDNGAVSDYYRMEGMILTLKLDAAQRAALDWLLAAQHDPA